MGESIWFNSWHYRFCCNLGYFLFIEFEGMMGTSEANPTAWHMSFTRVKNWEDALLMIFASLVVLIKLPADLSFRVMHVLVWFITSFSKSASCRCISLILSVKPLNVSFTIFCNLSYNCISPNGLRVGTTYSPKLYVRNMRGIWYFPTSYPNSDSIFGFCASKYVGIHMGYGQRQSLLMK